MSKEPANNDFNTATKADGQKSYIKVSHRDDGKMQVGFKNVSVNIPNTTDTLVENFNFTLNKGDRLILTGASGTGKTSLIRAVRELWENGEGEINLPKETNVVCVSQKAYMPNTNIKGVLSYPKPEKEFTDEQIEKALSDVGHDKLIKYLPNRKADSTKNTILDQVPALIDAYSESKNTINKIHADFLLKRIHIELKKKLIVGFQDLYLNREDDRALKDATDLAAIIRDEIQKELDKKANIQKPGTLKGIFNTISWPASWLKLRSQAKKVVDIMLESVDDQYNRHIVTGDDLAKSLSGGEQQRLVFARILLHQPDILILDEITAALDKESSSALYKDMIEKLPNTIIISVAHNTHIMPYHNLHGHLENKEITVNDIQKGSKPPLDIQP